MAGFDAAPPPASLRAGAPRRSPDVPADAAPAAATAAGRVGGAPGSGTGRGSRVLPHRPEDRRVVRQVAGGLGRGPCAARHRSGGMRAVHPSGVPSGPAGGAEPVVAGSAASRRWSPPQHPPTHRHPQAAARDHPARRPDALHCRRRIPRVPPAAAQPPRSGPRDPPSAHPAPSRRSRSVPDGHPPHHPAGQQGQRAVP
jgi:hypothetical protein